MARRAGSKNELIECEYCGERYSVTYKRCPFCNGDGTGRWDDPDSLEEEREFDEDEGPRTGGGKRLAGSRRGGGHGGPSIGRIILTVASLALIVAAVCIVISIVKSMLGSPVSPAVKASPGVESSVPSETPVGSISPAESGTPAQSEAPGESAAPAESQTPSAGTPTGFTLNREDFTFDAAGQVFQMKATFTPEGTTENITWKSSDPNVASVSWNGVVTSVAQGTATLTASVEGLGEKTCIVRCSFKSGETTTAANTSSLTGSGGTSSSVSGLKLNREDFTLGHSGETFRLVVSGTSSTVTWISSNTSVATVGTDGTVTAVAKGTCNVTATVNGTTLKCIVRCSF